MNGNGNHVPFTSFPFLFPACAIKRQLKKLNRSWGGQDAIANVKLVLWHRFSEVEKEMYKSINLYKGYKDKHSSLPSPSYWRIYTSWTRVRWEVMSWIEIITCCSCKAVYNAWVENINPSTRTAFSFFIAIFLRSQWCSSMSSVTFSTVTKELRDKIMPLCLGGTIESKGTCGWIWSWAS